MGARVYVPEVYSWTTNFMRRGRAGKLRFRKRSNKKKSSYRRNGSKILSGLNLNRGLKTRANPYSGSRKWRKFLDYRKVSPALRIRPPRPREAEEPVRNPWDRSWLRRRTYSDTWSKDYPYKGDTQKDIRHYFRVLGRRAKQWGQQRARDAFDYAQQRGTDYIMDKLEKVARGEPFWEVNKH